MVQKILKSSQIETPLGPMLAIANEENLLLLEFIECKGLEREIEHLKQKTTAIIAPGITEAILSIQKELKLYFEGQLVKWKTSFQLLGTPFQNAVWNELYKIPLGTTFSYFSLASSLGKPTAFRAVALANAANQLAIIIPCHRVINHNGKLGGYAGGLERKKWLLEHEKSYKLK